MNLEPEITFRDLERSPAIEAKVLERIERLDRYYSKIMGCRVMIEARHRHQHKGKLYHVRVDVTVPGHQLISSREPPERQSHEDVYVAIRDAFNAMDRQLEDFGRRQRGDVKTHELPPHGQVAELAPEGESGRILASDGRSIYFHRNSVVSGRFEDLEVGCQVRFVEVEGDEGPQASTVTLVGKHHIVG
ncbi:MAG: HPF/RaiA family ribosome-associated protein [Gammaproteobacteria bacterium]|jgi:ribosomal subunit interface protein